MSVKVEEIEMDICDTVKASFDLNAEDLPAAPARGIASREVAIPRRKDSYRRARLFSRN